MYKKEEYILNSNLQSIYNKYITNSKNDCNSLKTIKNKEKNLIAINPNGSYERNSYTSRRNKYSINIRYNM